MGKNKYRFKGHESFILREGWLNKGLYEVDRRQRQMCIRDRVLSFVKDG